MTNRTVFSSCGRDIALGARCLMLAHAAYPATAADGPRGWRYALVSNLRTISLAGAGHLYPILKNWREEK